MSATGPPEPRPPPAVGQETRQDGSRRASRDMRRSQFETQVNVKRFANQWQKKVNPSAYTSRRWTSDDPAKKSWDWDKEPIKAGLKWHKHYDSPESLKTGRILVIDYAKKDHSKKGMRKVIAQEISSLDDLHKLYSNPDRCNTAVLRVMHVQSADWAIPFLLNKFNISARDELVGTDFGRYVQYKRPERRGGKPFLSGKSWKTVHDPWRQISRTSFGLDYLKQYPCEKDPDKRKVNNRDKMMELQYYDENDNPRYGYDVVVQRISCYIQHVDAAEGIPETPDVRNPYIDNHSGHMNHKYVPHLDKLDNNNTIIIFENSETGSIGDTLIAAREAWEARWRRLPFYLAYETGDISNDEQMGLECSKVILQDIFKAVTDSWDSFLDACNTHVSILEDRIYEQPADESRAPELWQNSSMWLKVERLVAMHTVIVREMQNNLHELTGNDDDDDWLEGSPDDMQKITELVQDDLIKPTSSLSDLMYKSVEIRDSRHSLQLNVSMWRLSWITFVFLPLTFISTFFGMNVDVFSPGDPALKWYFASAIPMMVIVVIMYFIFKNNLSIDGQAPYQRGIYEEYFNDLANAYPRLWTRRGPREGISARTPLGRLKWQIILWWNQPEKTVLVGTESNSWNDLSLWARFKNNLTRQWTAQLRGYKSKPEMVDDQSDTDISPTASQTSLPDGATVAVVPAQEKASYAGAPDTGGATAYSAVEPLPDGMLAVPISRPQAQSRVALQERVSSSPPTLHQRRMSGGVGSATRPSSAGSSGNRNSSVMIEEEEPNWFSQLFGGGAGKGNTDKDDGGGGDTVRRRTPSRGRSAG